MLVLSGCKSRPGKGRPCRYLLSLGAAEELAVFVESRGHCLLDNGRIREARMAYEHACRLDPLSPGHWSWLEDARVREASLVPHGGNLNTFTNRGCSMTISCLPTANSTLSAEPVRTFPLDSTRYRNYHPTLGRWIERDPGDYVNGASLYQYSLSTPTRTTDPQGLYVNADLLEDRIGMEAGIVLWASSKDIPAWGWPWDSGVKTRPRDDQFDPKTGTMTPGVLSGVADAIKASTAVLDQAFQPFLVCHLESNKKYPIRWSVNVKKSIADHSSSKPGNYHYVEVKRNPYILGWFGGPNAFSPSISTHNDQGGWGVWDYLMGQPPDAWWAAHEILHFAGLEDKYSWLTGKPASGYWTSVAGTPTSTNIMAGSRYGKSTQLEKWQVEAILKDRLKERTHWELNVDYIVK